MGCFCFSRDNRDGIDGTTADDNPPKPVSTALDHSRDRRQRSSVAAPIPADSVRIPGTSGTPAPIPSTEFKVPMRDGLNLLASPVLDDESKKIYNIDVIAIHGLNGHPRDTWTYEKDESKVFWLQDFLPKALPGARIFTYWYDSRLFCSPSIGDIDTYAKGLLEELNLVRKRSSAQGSRTIIFICHSLGGLSLIIANEDRDRYQSILDSTKAIFFFGTPHQGSEFADTARYLSTFIELFNSELITGSNLVRTNLIKDLSPKSKVLEQLCKAFVQRAHKIPCIITFHEVNKINKQIIVSERSATIGVANEHVVPITGDHLEICRIKDENERAYQIIVQECQELGSAISDKHRKLNDKEQQCLDSLALPNLPDPSSTMITPAKGTCEWIFRDQQFNTWRNGLPPVLWISGGLGCGKTTLMSFLKDRMLENDAFTNATKNTVAKTSTVCSFFCDDRNKNLTNAAFLLQRLVLDIVSQRHDLLHHALDNYVQSRAWSYGDLWRIFQAILDDPHMSSVIVIIDALDECNKTDRMRLLENLGDYLERRSSNANSQISFVLSGRTSGLLPILKANTSYLELDQNPVLQKCVTTDIRRFVLHNLMYDDQFSARDDPDSSVKPEALANTIATKSGGSFLWASLILEILQTKSFFNNRQAEKIISVCPPDLCGVYYESLAKIDHESYKYIVKSFHILLAARRPLTKTEFKFALAVESGHQSLETPQRAVKEDLSRIIGYIRNILGNLVQTTGTTITLRHHSVKDFLLNRLATSQDSRQPKPPEYSSELSENFRMSINDAENTLARCCISFLNLEKFAKKRSAWKEDTKIWEDSGLGAISISAEDTPKSPNSIYSEADREFHMAHIPFFEYAASNWGLHYASSEAADEELTNAALKLSTRTNALVNWSDQFRRSYWGRDKLPESLDALIVAAYFGQTIMVRKLKSNSNFNSRWSVGLTWASRMGHTETVAEIVKILIELGTPCMGEIVDGGSALSWATAGGFLEIVDALLGHDRGLINVKDDDGRCPLTLAVENEHVKVVEKLLGLENIDVNLRSNTGATPIHYALGGPDHSAANLEIFRKLLRDHRVDITVRDKKDRSILSWAAGSGATKVTQELLNFRERQDDVERLLDDGGDKDGLSPLSYAAWNGHSNVIRMLCRTKKIDSQLHSVSTKLELEGANVFAIAARRQHAKMISELDDYYPAGVNSRDAAGYTPLSWAMWGNNADVVHALLKVGADINLPNNYGRTPISFGIGNIELVRILVEHGADINIPDEDGKRPLCYAQSEFHMKPELQAQLTALGAHL